MKLKTYLLAALTLGAIAVTLMALVSHEHRAASNPKQYLKTYGDALTFQQRVDEARVYTASHGLHTRYVILVDFNKPSGDPDRFRLYDLKERRTVLKSTCMHGAGKGSTASHPAFSNRLGSNNSCLGKFHTAGRHTTGRVGKYRTPCYNLVGKSGCANNNVQRRCILIHGWAEKAKRRGDNLLLNPHLSQGCFTIESAKVRQLGQIIEQSDRPLLLWAYHIKS